MDKLKIEVICNGCGKSFFTLDKDFCSTECEKYYDNYLDDHKDDEY